MVSIVTEVWALAGCGPASKAAAVAVAAQELPAQHPSPAAAGGGKAKKRAVPVSFRGVSSGGGQDHQREAAAVVVGRRRGLASCALAAVAASFSARAGRPARALVLEEDDDIELLERVKEDRKKRLQKQGIISSSGAETGLFTSHELQPLALVSLFFFSSSSSLHLRLDKNTSEALLSSSNRKPCCGLIRKTHRVFAGPHLQAQQSRAGH